MKIGCYLLVLAVVVHAVSAAPSPTCLAVAPASTVGWANATNTLDYVPTAFRSNCGYLTVLASSFCNQNCTNARACCAAACGWNSAGCGCATGKFPSFMRSIPVDGAEPLTPTQLSQSTCNLGTVYSGPNCENLPAGGSSICNRVSPPTEDATANALTSLIKMITFPASFNVTDKNAASQIKALVSGTGAIAVGKGLVYNKPLGILGRAIKPKLVLKNANLLKASVKRGSTESTGRSMLVSYGLQVRDIKGVSHKLGNYWAFATFSPCSNVIESLYLPKELTANQVQSYIVTFPRVAKVTISKAVQQAGRKLMEKCGSAAVAGPENAAGWMVSAVHTVAPYLPFVEYDPTRRSLAEYAVTEGTDTATAVPLQAASPPPPPPQSTRNLNSTLSTVGSGLVNGTNAILSSTAAQDALYTAYENSTFACPGSTLDNMQFCDGFSGSGTYDMSDTGIVSDTCTGLCAGGAWSDISSFTCDYGCGSAVEASCQSCQSGCSAACSSCTSGCNAACSTCQSGVTASCSTCQVGCCYGCQTCTPAVPESCCCGSPEGCCCKTCIMGSCCCKICSPATPDVCTPGVPSSCVNAQWCTCSSSGGGPCDQSVCNPTCSCSSTGSVCGSTCNCSAACASTCNVVCPNCDLDCQDSCESGLGSVGMEYSYSANFIVGMGALNMTGISSSETVSTYTPNTTNPSAQFGGNLSWDSLQVRVGFSATATPSYGAPIIPWTYITTTISQSTYNVLKSTFVTTQDCIANAGNNYKPTGKLSVTMTEFQLNTNWVPWQDIADELSPWTSIFGSAWIQDAAQAMAIPINNLLNNQAAPVVSNLLNPQFAAYDWGTYTCG
ncbi:hypothetical protein Ndes2526B_g01241 [Nannochloris sp. 'desiccata']